MTVIIEENGNGDPHSNPGGVYIFLCDNVLGKDMNPLLYSHLQHHNNTTIKTHEGKRRNEGRKKTSLQLYLPLTLFVRFRKGCSKVCM